MNTYLKENKSPFNDQLLCEAKGLKELETHCSLLKVPKVYEASEQSLLMDKVSSVPFSDLGREKLGKGLALMHKNRGEFFGLNHDNYIGLNPQINSESKNWGEFFVQNRLSIQIHFIQNPDLQAEFNSALIENSNKLIDFLNAHDPSPSPVHGDLWAGNILYDGDDAWLIDPAFYWGDREVDIAMSELFGEFGAGFYKAYEKEFPLSHGHEKRKVVYNLYHYLNHYNLFGEAYLSSVRDGLDFIKSL